MFLSLHYNQNLKTMCGQRDFEMDRDTIEMMRKDFVGKRIRCIEMKDDPDPIPSGSEGVVLSVDDMGTLHVKWDNGRGLGLVIEDKFEIIENPNDDDDFIDPAGGHGIHSHI